MPAASVTAFRRAKYVPSTSRNTGRFQLPFVPPSFVEKRAGFPAATSIDPTISKQVREVLQLLVETQLPASPVLAGAWGKTGTPDDGRTGWFVGVSGRLAAVAVVGAKKQARSKFAAQEAWARFVEEVAGLL